MAKGGFHLYVRWVNAATGNTKKKKKKKKKKSTNQEVGYDDTPVADDGAMKAVEVCVENLRWKDCVADVKRKIELEFGVPRAHQRIRVHRGRETSDKDTLVDLGCMLGCKAKEQSEQSKSKMRKRVHPGLLFSCANPSSSVASADTILLETRHTAKAYMPGGAHCTWTFYMRTCIASITPSPSAVMLVLILIVTAVLLWHVAAFEAPAIVPRPRVDEQQHQSSVGNLSSVEELEDIVSVAPPNATVTTAMPGETESSRGGDDGDL